jgi:hypothetical protein
MDPTRFDRCAKTLAAAGTRRGALGGLLAGTLSLLGLVDAAAKKRRHATAEGPCGNGSGKANACEKDKDCCTRFCKKGRCRCKKLGQGCKKNRNCCASAGQPMTCQSGSCQTVPPPCGACGACQTCDAATRQCVPIANRTICGGSGTTTSVCCNGTCCDGCCGGSDDSCGSCLVFATSSLHTGALGGLSGADSICQHRAGPGQGNLPGIYKAWLSNGTGPNSPAPANRFRHSQQPYRLVNGDPVAANWADLTTCAGSPSVCIDNPINISETGGSLESAQVWTYTLPDGTAGDSHIASASTCRNWESDEAVNCLLDPSGCGAIGADFFRDEFWTDANAIVPCRVAEQRLYCFQQS